jgi:hypothetical protein
VYVELNFLAAQFFYSTRNETFRPETLKSPPSSPIMKTGAAVPKPCLPFSLPEMLPNIQYPPKAIHPDFNGNPKDYPKRRVYVQVEKMSGALARILHSKGIPIWEPENDIIPDSDINK